MAVLTDQDRKDVWADWMRDQSDSKTSTGTLTKADIRAAIDAIDQWISDNSVSYNNAIPQPARGVLTNGQKAMLLSVIALKRYVKGV